MTFRRFLLPALAALSITLPSTPGAWGADEYNLKKVALKVGQKVSTESTMTLTDAEMVFSVQGQTIKGSMNMTERKVQETSIKATSDGAPTASETVTTEATQKRSMAINGQTKDMSKNQPLHGTTVASKLVDGKWENELTSGVASQEQDKALKRFKPFDPVDIYEDRPVAPGASWEVAPEMLAKMLGDIDARNAKGSMQCKFERVEALDGRPCAVLSVTMRVTGSPQDQPDSTLTMELKGNVFRSLEDKVDVKLDLAGTMKLEGAVSGTPMTASGPMTMKQTSTVSK